MLKLWKKVRGILFLYLVAILLIFALTNRVERLESGEDVKQYQQQVLYRVN